MLTLLVTVLATAYFVVPELLTRFVVSFYFVRKASTGTRSEEILRAAFWAIVPLTIAWWTRNVGWWTVPVSPVGSTQTVFTALYSDRAFDPATFYPAFNSFFFRMLNEWFGPISPATDLHTKTEKQMTQHL